MQRTARSRLRRYIVASLPVVAVFAALVVSVQVVDGWWVSDQVTAELARGSVGIFAGLAAIWTWYAQG